ncbi:MAG: hypothetical protein JXQ96_09395 [Cyclobacteriaceae bacterium]
MKLFLISLMLCSSVFVHGQSIDKLRMSGDYSHIDSMQIVDAYFNSHLAVNRMYDEMNLMWNVVEEDRRDKRKIRQKRWSENETFQTWLGSSDKMKLAYRRIKKIHSKYEKRIFLSVSKDNKGRCKGWISAWTLPYGKAKIRLCDNYLKYRTHLHEKILIHEMGHEVGMLFHRKIHGCWRAQQAAHSGTRNVAKRNPENYAWLAVSYLGHSCHH